MLSGRGRWLGGLCFAELLVLIASIPALGDPVAHVVDGDAVSRVAAELPLTTVVLYNSLNNILNSVDVFLSDTLTIGNDDDCSEIHSLLTYV